MILPSQYVPAARLFAVELTEAKAYDKDTNKFSTKNGIFGKDIAFIGALIDIIESGDKITSLRLSDPTGVCTANLPINDNKLQKDAKELNVPSFIYVFGTLRVSSQTKITPELSVSVIKPVTRETRNAWILQTAEETLHRLNDKPENAEFRKKIFAAVETAKPKEAAPVLSDEEILELVGSLYEGKSAQKEKVIESLIKRGMTKQQAMEAIVHLMDEGDLYAPKPDLLKVL